MHVHNWQGKQETRNTQSVSQSVSGTHRVDGLITLLLETLFYTLSGPESLCVFGAKQRKRQMHEFELMAKQFEDTQLNMVMGNYAHTSHVHTSDQSLFSIACET
jgi:hypothetical protein